MAHNRDKSASIKMKPIRFQSNKQFGYLKGAKEAWCGFRLIFLQLETNTIHQIMFW